MWFKQRQLWSSRNSCCQFLTFVSHCCHHRWLWGLAGKLCSIPQKSPCVHIVWPSAWDDVRTVSGPCSCKMRTVCSRPQQCLLRDQPPLHWEVTWKDQPSSHSEVFPPNRREVGHPLPNVTGFQFKYVPSEGRRQIKNERKKKKSCGLHTMLASTCAEADWAEP